ncbi:MAG: MgtC/SapB family protein [bacterium]|nr:MgtC/SapB family protein [bacterium]
MEIEIILKVILTAVLGGIIGLEQHVTRKEAGLRANILIAIGSTLYTILSLKLAEISKTADPALMASQIVIGVGLLGAGVIVRSRFSSHGLINASVVWIVAAVGIAVGSGLYLISFMVTIFVVLILTSLKFISLKLDIQSKLFSYVISTDDRASVLIDIKKIITESGIKYVNANLKKVDNGFEVEIALNTSKNKNHEFVEEVMQLPGVKEIASEYL